jgi:hypothetical protein
MIWNNSRTGCDLHEAQVQSEHDAPAESWINPRDGSVVRLIPAGEFIMGSTQAQIEAARLMDISGHEFTLLDELPPFRALVPDYYVNLDEHLVRVDQDDVRFPGPLGVLPVNVGKVWVFRHTVEGDTPGLSAVKFLQWRQLAEKTLYFGGKQTAGGRSHRFGQRLVGRSATQLAPRTESSVVLALDHQARRMEFHGPGNALGRLRAVIDQVT